MADNLKVYATIAGLSLFTVILIAFSQIPAWIPLLGILVVVSFIGRDLPTSHYTQQYDDQQVVLKERQRKAHEENLSEAKAIAKYGIYIKPEHRAEYMEEHKDEYDRLPTNKKVNTYRV